MSKTAHTGGGVVARSGPIHSFEGDDAALAAFEAADDGEPVPVVVRSLSAPGVVGRGTLVDRRVEGGQIVGTVEWPEAIDRIAGSGPGGRPAATCEFSGSGALRRVVIDLEGEPDGGHACGCDGACRCGTAAFRKWSKADRDALPDDDFGDPEARLFPVADRADLDSAARLIGKAKDPARVKKRLVAIARRKGLTLPESWADGKDAAMSDGSGNATTDASVRDLAMFDLGPPTPDGDWVAYENSLLFRAGDYESHDFSMTPEELWAAVESFSGPVPNEIDHVNTLGSETILDGKLGQVEAVRLSAGPDGHELRGTVKIPRWLDRVWDAPTKQVSCVWDRGSKTLRRLGLVVKGRVEGAALFAAFSAARDRTMSGQATLQSIHDRCAESGALCRDDPAFSGSIGRARRPALFHAAPELRAIQAAHDAACEGGARCRTYSKEEMDRRGAMFSQLATFTPRKRTEHAAKHHQLIHDVIYAGYPAICQGKPAAGGGDPAGGIDQASGTSGTTDAAPAAMSDSPYGYCPQCGAKGTLRERRINGNDTCENGHTYPSRDALDRPKAAAMSDSPEQLKALKSIHRIATEHGATCPGKAKMSAGNAGNNPLARFRMSKFQPFLEAVGQLPDAPTDADLLAVFRAAPRDVIEAVAKEAPPDPLAAFADNPHFKALKEKADRLEAKAEADRVAKITAEVATFADKQAARLLLNEEATARLKAALFAAAELDRTEAGVVAFSLGGQAHTARLADALRAVLESLPDNPMTHQVVEANGQLPAGFSVLGSGERARSAEELAEERRILLSKTPAGQAVLDREAAAARR